MDYEFETPTKTTLQYSSTQLCNTLSCVSVPGNWGPWGAWEDCNCKTLSETRYRYCDKPAPINGGDECQGDHTQAVDCTENNCPSKSQYHSVL